MDETQLMVDKLNKAVQIAISGNKKHKWYKRVCDLADEYEAYIADEEDENGDKKLDKYLRRFVRREDKDLFEQRKNITKQYTPSICAQIMHPFTKVIRSNRVQKLINNQTESNTKIIDAVLVKFYGESEQNGVDQFMMERFKTLTFTDPNAWFWCGYDTFDHRYEKPQTYPVEYSSKQVIDFEIINDQTQWVLIQLDYPYKNKEGEAKFEKEYFAFGSDWTVHYKRIPDNIDSDDVFVDENTSIWIEPKSKNKYAVYQYEHNSERVPLMRVGYRKDIKTKGATFVNPFHYEAMPLLRQIIKVSSEFQLSITLHTFPKQVTYYSPCDAKGCDDGKLHNGNDCEVCEGTGRKNSHTTAADILEIPLPPTKMMNELVSANQLSSYIQFPGDVMKFLDEYVDKLEKKIIRMVFNSESIVQTQFNTATEANFDMDSIYDTLYPFAYKYSEIWMFFVKLTCLYLGYSETEVWHKFPTDFKLKSMSQLLTELKLANDSGAPSYIRENINNDISEIIYADDPEVLAKIQIKNKFHPFPGKTDDEIQMIILNNLTTEKKKVLFANYDSIMDDLEQEHGEAFFTKFEAKKQRDLIDEKVELLIGEIKESAAAGLNLNV